MKTTYFIIVLLAVALVVLAVKVATISTVEKAAEEADSAAFELSHAGTIESILTRSSVRDYTDRDVTPQQVDTLLRAAMAAPTARNCQPWKFIVVRDRALLDSIAANCKTITMAAKAPLAIVVCGDLSKALEGESQAFWIQDCSAATENLLLAAHAMGLGAVWCGIYPKRDRIDFLSSLLEIPEGIVPLNVIPVGYPAVEPNIKDKFDFHAIHYNKYGRSK